MSHPALERAEGGNALRLGDGVDAPCANHLCHARHAGDAVRAHTVAVRFSDQPRSQPGAIGESEAEQNVLYASSEFLEWHTKHDPH
jgi:hypothetical protein